MTREKAIEIIKDYKVWGCGYCHQGGDEVEEAFQMAIKALEQKSKTGHWIEEDVFDGDVAYRCSECNELFWLESGTPKDYEYNYCPKCGAKMIESQERSDKE